MTSKQIMHRVFCSEYKLIRKEKDYHLGQYMLMKNTLTKRRVIVKNHQCQSQQILNIIINDYQKLNRMHQQCEFLCSFVGYCIEQTNSTLSINLIYDYSHSTLQEQISAMALKNQKFSQKELDCFIGCGVRALSFLEKFGFNHTCLKYSNLLVENRNSIDLVYRIFYTPYLTQAVMQIKQNKANVDEYNLSQRQLQLLNKQAYSQTISINTAKFASYNQYQLTFNDKLRIDKQSFGLMALRMATFNQCKHGIYTLNDRNQLVWDIKQLKSRWDVLSKNYSKQLVQKIHYLFSDDRAFYSFKDIPSYIIIKINSSLNTGSQSRVRNSGDKSFSRNSRSKNSRSKSPSNRMNNKNSSNNSSQKKYIDVSASKLSHSRQSIISGPKVNQHSSHISAMRSVPRIRAQSLQNSKSSIQSRSLSPFSINQSPTKVKSNKYQSIKSELQQRIFHRIPQNHRQVVKTEDGSEYIGYINKETCIKQGYGICYFKQGDIYAGEWKNDQIEGYGSYLFQNCDVYTGQVSKGLKHGNGKYVYSNGNVYEGEWKFDKKQGYGIFQNKQKGQKYQGEWVGGNKQGQGIYKWKNGDKYEGGFLKGIKSGNGTVTKYDGTKITGQWYNDNLRGVASIKFRSGVCYMGQLTQNSLNGANKLFLQGKGSQIAADGTNIKTEYKLSKRNGYSKIQFLNGDIYEGKLKNDKFEGQGTYFFNHLNCTFSGTFYSGLQTGKGVLQFVNGTKIQTEWNQGLPSNVGKITYGNGDYYQGQINRLGRNGNGVYFKSNGQKIQGFFRNGVLIRQNL